jgi:hypothetical protein
MSTDKVKSTIIACIVTGIEKRVSKNVITKGISKFGSFEQFKKHYIDRSAKKLLKQRQQPEEVQKKLLPKGKQGFVIDKNALIKLKLLKKPKNTKVEYKDLTFTPKPPVKWASFQAYVESMTEHACLRPDIYLDNGRCCVGCPYVEFCICSVKKLKPGKR